MENQAVSGKINGISSASQPQQVGAGSAGQASRNMSGQSGIASGAGAASPGPAGTDQVDITGAASELATAEQSLSSVPVINQGKVSTIRGAVEAGTYKVQPQKIARKLVEFEQGLPGASDADSSSAA